MGKEWNGRKQRCTPTVDSLPRNLYSSLHVIQAWNVFLGIWTCLALYRFITFPQVFLSSLAFTSKFSDYPFFRTVSKELVSLQRIRWVKWTSALNWARNLLSSFGRNTVSLICFLLMSNLFPNISKFRICFPLKYTITKGNDTFLLISRFDLTLELMLLYCSEHKSLWPRGCQINNSADSLHTHIENTKSYNSWPLWSSL